MNGAWGVSYVPRKLGQGRLGSHIDVAESGR